MDLDGFKDVNDTFGHEVGDALLCEVAERVSACVRDEDTVARHSGDEFTVILAGAKQRNDVELVAQKIRDALGIPFQIARHPVHIAASIGISSYPQDATSPLALLHAADRAMYEAKNAGPDGKGCRVSGAPAASTRPQLNTP